MGLTFLAKKRYDHKQSTFYLQHLQADWLPTEPLVALYNQLATIGIGFMFGTLMGLSINAVIFGGDLFAFNMLYALLRGLLGGLIAGRDTPGFRFSSMRLLFYRVEISLISPSLFGNKRALLSKCEDQSTSRAFKNRMAPQKIYPIFLNLQ